MNNDYNQDNNIVYPSQVTSPVNVKKTNGFAIAGFILTFFTIIIGFVLCIVGLVESKKYNSGKWLSIGGIIISLLKLAVVVIIIAFFGAIMNTSEFREAYCENMEAKKDTQCTLLNDGSYDCIFAVCRFKNNYNEEEISDDLDEREEEILNDLDEREEEVEEFMDKESRWQSEEFQKLLDDIKYPDVSKNDIIDFYESNIKDNVIINDVSTMTKYEVEKVVLKSFTVEPEEFVYSITIKYTCSDGTGSCFYVSQSDGEDRSDMTYDILYKDDKLKNITGSGMLYDDYPWFRQVNEEIN